MWPPSGIGKCANRDSNSELAVRLIHRRGAGDSAVNIRKPLHHRLFCKLLVFERSV